MAAAACRARQWTTCHNTAENSVGLAWGRVRLGSRLFRLMYLHVGEVGSLHEGSVVASAITVEPSIGQSSRYSPLDGRP